MKCLCTECAWHGIWSEILKAPNPFDPEDTISGCPNCKSVEGTLRQACYETNCWREGTCGTSNPDGYRWSCFDHSGFKKAP